MVDDNRWRNRIGSHQINQHLAELRARIGVLAAEVPQAESVSELSHLELLCNLCLSRLQTAGPELVTQSMLDRLDGAINGCRTAIDAQVGSMNEGNPFN
jgi:hypothetical protein